MRSIPLTLTKKSTQASDYVKSFCLRLVSLRTRWR